ncbi:hypothetical protein E2E33_010900 [Bacillus coagulans]|nr:hypothetical protein [Heyndrickxia coagulans]
MKGGQKKRILGGKFLHTGLFGELSGNFIHKKIRASKSARNFYDFSQK